ncbi:MAG TPA: hypothetical protein VJ768_06745 [Anaerolineales bacterium]|nr:hypothetical protein [Anaerolineales bacterium]
MNPLYAIDPESDLGPTGPPTQDPGDPAARPPTGAVCIPNISTAERRKRLVSGLVAFAIGLAILVALVLTGADRLWRLPLFLLFASAASGFFQWRDKT